MCLFYLKHPSMIEFFRTLFQFMFFRVEVYIYKALKGEAAMFGRVEVDIYNALKGEPGRFGRVEVDI